MLRICFLLAVGSLSVSWMLIPPAIRAQSSTAPQVPVSVSEEEAQSHRIGQIQPVKAQLDPMLGGELPGGPIDITVVVGPDGTVLSANAQVSFSESDFESTRFPKQLLAQFRHAVSQAEAEVRGLRYRPFERGGHAVTATFWEEVLIVPETAPLAHVEFPQVRDWNSLRMKLDRTTCLGTCPSYSIEVRGDGTVLYEGRAFVATLGQHHHTISQKKVADLLDAFRQSDYFSLHDYRWGATDLPTFTSSIEFDGHSKRVVDYGGPVVGMPAVATELEKKIDELSDSERWTKGNAHTFRSLAEEKWDFTSGEAAKTLARMAMYGSADAVCELVHAGVPLNGDAGDLGLHGTPLEQAAYRGDLEMVRCMLQTKPLPDSAGLSAGLSRAAAAGKLDTVKVLLQYGANADAAAGKSGPWKTEPPLVAAASSGVPAVVQEILNHRPNLTRRGHEGRTALIAAVTGWQWQDRQNKEVKRLEVVRLLLAAGADFNSRDDKGNSALIENAWSPEIAGLLLQAGADINATNNDGWTPLFSASSADLTRFLLQHGASVTVRNKKGDTPLKQAKQYGNAEIVAVLEEAEAAARK